MESNKKFIPDPDLKLMDQVRQVLQYHHYVYPNTAKTFSPNRSARPISGHKVTVARFQDLNVCFIRFHP